jgi:hypothetical protein
MHLTMMPSTQRHGEFIADLAAECPALRESQVVGIARLPTANQTRLLGYITEMLAVPHSARLGQSQCALINCLYSRQFRRPSQMWITCNRQLLSLSCRLSLS